MKRAITFGGVTAPQDEFDLTVTVAELSRLDGPTREFFYRKFVDEGHAVLLPDQMAFEMKSDAMLDMLLRRWRLPDVPLRWVLR